MRMLCIPLGHAGALGSAQWLIRPSRVYSPGENSVKKMLWQITPLFTLVENEKRKKKDSGMS